MWYMLSYSPETPDHGRRAHRRKWTGQGLPETLRKAGETDQIFFI
jgi:hypothetical protein